MDRALYLSMSGAKQNMQALQLRANNLANASTPGFRADLAQARSMQAYGEGMPSRVFSMTERPGHNFEQGSVVTTGRDLDVTIEGQGWISVLDKNGKEGLTRNGSLRVDQNGLLVNGNGNLVLGERGTPITVPIPLRKIEIGAVTAPSLLYRKMHLLTKWKSLTVSSSPILITVHYSKTLMVYFVIKILN